jgi:hypothetical protein
MIRLRFICSAIKRETAKSAMEQPPEHPEKPGAAGEQEYARNRQSRKDVNRISNPRIQAVRDERLRLGTHRE